jgi:2-oxoglutarate dehydrogenase E2 component (dihydrolipoamide succinyltransferase)
MTDVVMPQMGESIVEGTLTKWLKKKGEHIERDEPLFEISTDKVDTEIPSPAAGTLSEVLVEEGKTVGINTVVARISEGASDGAAPAEKPAEAAAPAPKAEEPAKAAEPASVKKAVESPAAPAPAAAPPAPAPPATPQADSAGEAGGPLSPLVRRMARENNIDLGRVKGTGAGGRITKQDLEAFQAQTPSAPPPAAPVEKPAAAAAPAPATPAPTGPAQAKVRIEPMSAMRKAIAEHMVMSKRTSAHVTTIHKVDMTQVEKMRQKHKADFQARYGLSLTYLPFITRAAVEGLRTYPLLNASIDGANIVYHNEINIGIAVALENGLIVPVIRAADEKNVLGLQRAIADLATRARSRQLKPDEVKDGTFSITSFGGFGSVIATPVINQPQVAILGAGVVEKQPVVIDDAIDGALADQFTGKVKSVLENWSDEVL